MRRKNKHPVVYVQDGDGLFSSIGNAFKKVGKTTYNKALRPTGEFLSRPSTVKTIRQIATPLIEQGLPAAADLYAPGSSAVVRPITRLGLQEANKQAAKAGYGRRRNLSIAAVNKGVQGGRRARVAF